MNRAIVLFDPSKKTNLQHCLKEKNPIKILTHLYEMQRLTGNTCTKKYGNSSKYDIRLTNIELNTIAMYYSPLFSIEWYTYTC